MTEPQKAYIAPFALFMALLAALPLVRPWIVLPPEQFVYPLQTLVCGLLLAIFWRDYDFQWPAQIVFTLAIAVLIFGIWISPQLIWHAPARFVGFDPFVFASNRPLFWSALLFRCARLVIVVPLLEEIFWRGFLLRDLIRPNFTDVPMGTFSAFSFTVVALMFALAHWGSTWRPGPDFVPAIITGALLNLVAYRTRSLGSCVLAHAAANLLLGAYIVSTRQWGFW